MSNTKKLEVTLDKIWRAGDKDEMSIKHIGHGLAAVIAYGDWTEGDDYNLPNWYENEVSIEALRKRITPLWEAVEQMKNELGTDDFIEVVRQSKFSFYPLEYLTDDWLSYSKAEVKYNYSVWVGGGEVNGFGLTKEQAQSIAEDWREQGYTEVAVRKEE